MQDGSKENCHKTTIGENVEEFVECLITSPLTYQHPDDLGTEIQCSPPLPKPKAKSSRSTKTDSTNAFEEKAQKRMAMLEDIHKRKRMAEAEDHVDLFMKSVSLTIKNLPPLAQLIINKAKIAILTLRSKLH